MGRLGFLVAFAASLLGQRDALGHDLACPHGEITLQADRVRATRRGTGLDRLEMGEGTFVVPVGAAIDPTAEAITFLAEVDHRLLQRADLAPGALTADVAALAGGGRLALRATRGGWRLGVRWGGLDLAALDGPPPAELRTVLKVGDDCFSAVLECATRGNRLRCVPARRAVLHGRVRGSGRTPLAGVMLTASDDTRLESVSVFSQEDGRFVFPRLRPGTYRLRARRIGFAEERRDAVVVRDRAPTTADFSLTTVADFTEQLPATYFLARMLEHWPDPVIRGDFTLSCGNCHQIGGPRFRRPKTDAQWRSVLTRMESFLPPYFQTTRDLLIDNVIAALGPNAPPLVTEPPPALAGEVLGAIVYEYGLGDATARPGCHDLELGTDGVVYADGGVRWIDPRSGARGLYPINGGAHSIERAPDGDMWITQADGDTLAKLDLTTKEFTYYPLPRLGDDQGSYPHTLRFDREGRIWLTLTKSNHLAMFDPGTAAFEYHRLPTADPAETGLSIPVAYGCDVGPDDDVWFSQLFGQRIGRYRPSTGELRAWKPPFWGPRRLHVDQNGIVWVPGYGAGVLGRFDPVSERWKVYDLPTGVPAAPGFGTSETPYSLNANRATGDVWITGSNSDTLIRFLPDAERFTVVPLPTAGSFTREIEFDPDNNVWTCTSNEPANATEPGRGKFVKVELPAPGARCGNGRRDPGEECDDGNANDCDGCTSECRVVTGCGDGARCGSEQCDDGNTTSCDGCSATCQPEQGLRCGDGLVASSCGEECDPPTSGACTFDCRLSHGCGDGVRDPGEACDDGNADDCDGCTVDCRLVTGCGDGVVCGAEECDDGNTVSCDGCDAVCALETGYVCGDGVVDPLCGEECDPPSDLDPACSYRCVAGVAEPLGTRRFSFGGQTYTSALGAGVPLGTLVGALDLVAGAPGADGITAVTVAGPVFYRAPILGGAFGNLCVRLDGCTGSIDCNGGTAVGVEVVQDSAGPGRQGKPVVATTGLGADGGAGAILLSCTQAIVQTSPAATDCTVQTFPPAGPAVYTTGQTEGFYLNGDPRIGTGRLAIRGAPFDCATWTVEDGLGALAVSFLNEDDPQAGDTVNANLLDD